MRDEDRIRRVLSDRGMASHVNDTKWQELCHAVRAELPFPPPYQVKFVEFEAPDVAAFPYAPSFVGDWGTTYEGQLGIHIEWIRIAPRLSKHRGELVSPTVEECSYELRALLKRLHVPFVEQDGFFIVYGHSTGITTTKPGELTEMRTR
jgi:hypothetical protein